MEVTPDSRQGSDSERNTCWNIQGALHGGRRPEADRARTGSIPEETGRNTRSDTESWARGCIADNSKRRCPMTPQQHPQRCDNGCLNFGCPNHPDELKYYIEWGNEGVSNVIKNNQECISTVGCASFISKESYPLYVQCLECPHPIHHRQPPTPGGEREHSQRCETCKGPCPVLTGSFFENRLHQEPELARYTALVGCASHR